MRLNVLTFFAAASLACAASPAEVAIERARTGVAARPTDPKGYSELAMAFARRARETSDTAWYTRAEETIDKALEIAPQDFEARKTRAWLLLGRHEFGKARELAVELNKQNPDDVTVYGYRADANAELGNYDEAVTAAQWMLNLRPGNVAGLTRAAYLRELHGDPDGALALMQEAWESTPASQTEDRAWLLTQMSHLQLQKGNTAEARRYAKGALDLFPGYHYALGMLGRIEVATGECAKAVGFFRERYQGAPHAENLFELAEALSCSGEGKQADAAFREFETKALTESVSADNANHELVAYYLDHAHRPERALEIALAERARRHDAYTLDALARSLAAVGQYDEARKTMQAALEFGTQDPALLRHSMSIQALAEKPRNSR